MTGVLLRTASKQPSSDTVSAIPTLLSGGISYSPAPLEPPADSEVLICCAQPGTAIVLDM